MLELKGKVEPGVQIKAEIIGTGPRGYTPVKGKDYWTPAEFEEIVNAPKRAEEARALAESARERAEELRDTAENARNTAETERKTAEDKRAEAEILRSKAEKDREEFFVSLDGKISELKTDLADKLPKSPTDWEPWTAEEQAAARERIWIDEPYELIESITLSEGVVEVKRDTEEDGTPYNFRYMIITIYEPKVIGSYILTGCEFDGSNYTNIGEIQSRSKYGYISLKMSNKKCIFNGMSASNPTISSFVYGNYYESANKVVDGYITQLVLRVLSTKPFCDGTEIKIYGVRA